MRSVRLVTVLSCLALIFSLAPVALAQPVETPRGAPEVHPGREPAERGRSASAPGRQDEQPAPAPTLTGQPRNDVIVDVPVNPDDASIPLNLIPYHEFPERLRALQASDRMSVEIIGQSVEGRDLHLVVATSPMTDAEWAEWQRLSDLRTEDPDAALAAFEAGAYDGWKSPIFFNNNIHGNEWEGTDAAFQLLDRLATADDAETQRLLDEHLVVVVISQNPDGRVNATRANANGFDMNRDFITASQPETRIVREQLIRYNPLTMLDLHGYVSCTLIEPTTGPHGDNYEYDLYIRNALRNALAMEERVLALGEDLNAGRCTNPDGTTHVDIPYRDDDSGWDDWPPIFTPMYAMYHGIVGHTIEFPWNPRGGSLTEAQRHERTRINTAVALATMEANLDWVNANRLDVLADQLEIYRRGAAGEPLRPIDDPLALELARGDNAQTVEIDLPRAYVIPVGGDQRSDSAAHRLAQFLIANDVQVEQARNAFRLDGTRYPAGSYLIDMHQPKRGLANVILDLGRDVSQDYPTMYDISAWSHSALWGATVHRIESGDLDVRRTAVAPGQPTGSVAPGRAPFIALEVVSEQDVQAVNLLREAGVELRRLPDGTFVIPGSAAAQVREAAHATGATFTTVTPARARSAETFDVGRIGVAGFNDEVFALERMGFDVTRITHGGFNTGAYTFADFDALYIGSTAFNPNSLNATQAAAFDAWLAAGGAVVGRGSNGVTFNTRAGLLDVTVGTGPGGANGIVAVENNPDSPITFDAQPYAFMSAPRYFTSIGEGVRVDQRLLAEDFFLAGHWRTGQEAAAGQPVVVSGQARGATVTLFGTEPLYRAHPEGMFTQVARALWLAG